VCASEGTVTRAASHRSGAQLAYVLTPADIGLRLRASRVSSLGTQQFGLS
jgi:hypothetical protein